MKNQQILYTITGRAIRYNPFQGTWEVLQGEVVIKTDLTEQQALDYLAFGGSYETSNNQYTE